jgi:hypothetical protein
MSEIEIAAIKALVELDEMPIDELIERVGLNINAPLSISILELLTWI